MINGQNLYLIKILTWFSALIIVLFHYALWFNLNSYEENKFIDYLVKRKEFGANFVYLYWCITGYIFIAFNFLNKKIDLKTYLINIFAKYYPLHILTLIVVLIIQSLNLNIYGKTQFGYANDLYHFTLHLFFASDWGLHINQSFNAPVWFMSILIPILGYFYLTFRILIKFKVFFSIFTMLFFYYIYPIIFGYQKSIFNFQACFFYFYLGISIFYISKLKKITKKIFQLSSIIFITISLFALNYNNIYNKNILLSYSINYIPSTVLLFSSLIFLCQDYYIKTSYTVKLLSRLMNTSYSIYLWHFPLQLTFIMIFKILNFNIDLFKDLSLFIIFFIILFLISLFSLKKFELPFENLIKKKLNSNK